MNESNGIAPQAGPPDPRQLDAETAAAWLMSPRPMEEEPFGEGQDWSLVFPGTLLGGLEGHLRFYLNAPIPNAEKRRFLLNAIHVLAWRELDHLYPKKAGSRWAVGPPPPDAIYRREKLLDSIDLAEASKRPDLRRWASAVISVLEKEKRPRIGFWCYWGWLWQSRFIYFLWP